MRKPKSHIVQRPRPARVQLCYSFQCDAFPTDTTSLPKPSILLQQIVRGDVSPRQHHSRWLRSCAVRHLHSRIKKRKKKEMTLAFPREGQTPIFLSFQVSSFQMNPVTTSMLSVHHYEPRSRQSHYLQSSTGGSARFSLERLFTALWTFPTMAFSFSSLVLWSLLCL